MHKYTHFIPENIAPVGAEKIGVYDSNGKRIGSIPLGRLTPPKGTRLYRFLAVADIHRTKNTANEDHQRALAYAEQECDFIVEAGDLTEQGSVESQMASYKSDGDTYAPTTPRYAIPGNHEHYSTYSYSYLEQYTGHPLYYSFEQGNDVFIMVGHYGGWYADSIGWHSDETWSTEELQWLYETLEANRNKRCFVFTHVLPHEHGVGNPNNLYVTAGKPLLWYTNDGGIGEAFISLLRHYKNTILFHGHSHTRFWLQELDAKANYSDADGYRSVHIPSLSVPRDPATDGIKLTDVYAESEGYVVDVYDDCIVLNGRDFIDNDADGHGIGIATYKIDTPLVEIPEKTFTDSTGTITT